MGQWSSGLSGAASGAAAGSAILPGWGTAIGAGVGGLAGFLSGDDSAAQAAADKRAAMYEQLMREIGGDPRSKAALDELDQLAHQQGLTAAEKASMLEGQSYSTDFARGQEGAIANRQLAMGGGSGIGGQTAALQEQAASQGANRLSMAGSQAAGQAEQRRLAALDSYMSGVQRMQQMKLQAAGGLSGAYGGQQDLAERQTYANAGNVSHALDTAGLAALSYRKAGQTSPPVADPFAGGGSPSAANSGAVQPAPPVAQPQAGAMTADQAARQYGKDATGQDFTAFFDQNGRVPVMPRGYGDQSFDSYLYQR